MQIQVQLSFCRSEIPTLMIAESKTPSRAVMSIPARSRPARARSAAPAPRLRAKMRGDLAGWLSAVEALSHHGTLGCTVVNWMSAAGAAPTCGRTSIGSSPRPPRCVTDEVLRAVREWPLGLREPPGPPIGLTRARSLRLGDPVPVRRPCGIYAAGPWVQLSRPSRIPSQQI